MRIQKVLLTFTQEEMISDIVGTPEKVKIFLEHIKEFECIDQDIEEITLSTDGDYRFDPSTDFKVLVDFIYPEVHRDVSDSDDDTGGGDPTSGSDAGVGAETDRGDLG